MDSPDILIEGNARDTVFLFRPLTNFAAEWLSENVSEDALWFGNALAVEHRYVDALIERLTDAGMIVNDDEYNWLLPWPGVHPANLGRWPDDV